MSVDALRYFPTSEGTRWTAGTAAQNATGPASSGEAIVVNAGDATTAVLITGARFYDPVGGQTLTAKLWESNTTERASSVQIVTPATPGYVEIPFRVPYWCQNGSTYVIAVHTPAGFTHSYAVVTNQWTTAPTPVTVGPITAVSGSAGRFGNNTTACPTSTSASFRRVDAMFQTMTKPSASNTGVPSGTTLTAQSGNITVTVAGTIVQNLDLQGKVIIKAANVTVRRCRIKGIAGGDQGADGLVDCRDAAAIGTLVEDCELAPTTPSYMWNSVMGHDVTVRRCNMYGTTDSVGIYNTNAPGQPITSVVEDSYMHDYVWWANDPYQTDGTHNDGLEIQGGTDLVMRRNNIDWQMDATKGDGASRPSTAPWGQGFVEAPNVPGNMPINNVRIVNNWLDGGGATVAANQIPDGMTSFTFGAIANNRIGRNQKDYGNGSKYPIRVRVGIFFTEPLESNRWMDTNAAMANGRNTGIRYDGVVPASSFTSTTGGLAAAFTDTSSQFPTSWAWDFGDGTTSTLQNPTKTYTAAGTYTVTLIATNQVGAGSTATNSVTVSGGAATTYPATGKASAVSTTSANTTRVLAMTGSATAVSTAVGSTTPPRIKVVSRSGSRLMIDGQLQRWVGGNFYDGILTDNNGQACSITPIETVRSVLNAMRAKGFNEVRVLTMLISFGNPNTLHPTLDGPINPAVKAATDRFLFEAAERGISVTATAVEHTNAYKYCGTDTLFAQLVLGAGATRDDFYTNATVIAKQRQILQSDLNLVNDLTGRTWRQEIAVLEEGNELYYAPKSWALPNRAWIKSQWPDLLVFDGTSASGMDVPGWSLTDPNTDGGGIHAYENEDGVAADDDWAQLPAPLVRNMRALRRANKIGYLGEWSWLPTSGRDRAAYIAAIEQECEADSFWCVTGPDTYTHNDSFQLRIDQPENATQAAGLQALSEHAGRMTTTQAPDAPAQAWSDQFTGTSGDPLNPLLWSTYVNAGDSVTIQGNRARFAMSANGGYSDQAAIASQAPAVTDQVTRFEWTPSAVAGAEMYLVHTLRAQSRDRTHDYVEAYRLEIDNQNGTYSITYRLNGASTLIQSGLSLPYWVAGQATSFEWSIVGTAMELRVWSTATSSRPSTTADTVAGKRQMWAWTTSQLTKPGYSGVTVNGGNAAVARTVDLDNWSMNVVPALVATGLAAATSLVGGNATQLMAARGTGASTSSTSAPARQTMAATGSSSAASSTAATGGVQMPVTGSAASVSTTRADSSGAVPAYGQAAAVSATSGSVTMTQALTGRAAAVSTAAGAVTGALQVGGRAAATSAATAVVGILMPATGSAASTSSTQANTTPSGGAVGGTAAASSTTVGNLSQGQAVGGTAAASSTTVGESSLTRGMEGDAEAVSTTAGSPALIMAATGQAIGVGGASGEFDTGLQDGYGVDGYGEGGTGYGAPPQELGIAGSATAVSLTDADPVLLLAATGAATATSGTSASAGRTFAVSGTAASVSSTSADSTLYQAVTYQVGGQALSVSTTTANATRTLALSGAATAIAATSGATTQVYQVGGTAAATSRTAADYTTQGATTFAVEGSAAAVSSTGGNTRQTYTVGGSAAAASATAASYWWTFGVTGRAASTSTTNGEATQTIAVNYTAESVATSVATTRAEVTLTMAATGAARGESLVQGDDDWTLRVTGSAAAVSSVRSDLTRILPVEGTAESDSLTRLDPNPGVATVYQVQGRATAISSTTAMADLVQPESVTLPYLIVGTPRGHIYLGDRVGRPELRRHAAQLRTTDRDYISWPIWGAAEGEVMMVQVEGNPDWHEVLVRKGAAVGYFAGPNHPNPGSAIVVPRTASCVLEWRSRSGAVRVSRRAGFIELID